MQEYDPRRQALVGEPRTIFRGTALGCTEGPHIYKRAGWYHLLTAEGGTGFGGALGGGTCVAGFGGGGELG